MADDSATNNSLDTESNRPSPVVPTRTVSYQALLELPDLTQEFLSFSNPSSQKNNFDLLQAFTSGAGQSHSGLNLSLGGDFSVAALQEKEDDKKRLEAAFITASTATGPSFIDTVWDGIKTGVSTLLSTMIARDEQIFSEMSAQYTALTEQQAIESAHAQDKLITSAATLDLEAEAEELLTLQDENKNLQSGVNIYEQRLNDAQTQLDTYLTQPAPLEIASQESHIDGLKEGQERFTQGIADNLNEIEALKNTLGDTAEITNILESLSQIQSNHQEQNALEIKTLDTFQDELVHKNILENIWADSNFTNELKSCLSERNDQGLQLDRKSLRGALSREMNLRSLPLSELEPIKTLTEELLQESGLEITPNSTPLFSASLDITNNSATALEKDKIVPSVPEHLISPENG